MAGGGRRDQCRRHGVPCQYIRRKYPKQIKVTSCACHCDHRPLRTPEKGGDSCCSCQPVSFDPLCHTAHFLRSPGGTGIASTETLEQGKWFHVTFLLVIVDRPHDGLRRLNRVCSNVTSHLQIPQVAADAHSYRFCLTISNPGPIFLVVFVCLFVNKTTPPEAVAVRLWPTGRRLALQPPNTSECADGPEKHLSRKITCIVGSFPGSNQLAVAARYSAATKLARWQRVCSWRHLEAIRRHS